MRYTVTWRCAVGIGLGLAFGGAPAQGQPRTFEFEGVIDFVEEGIGVDPSVAVGVPFFGTYTFDPTAATDGSPNDSRVGSYYFGFDTRMQVEIGNYAFFTEDLTIGVWNNVNGEDLYRSGSSYPFYALGRQWLIMDIVLRDLTGMAFASDALPTTPPDLADFGFRTAFAMIENGHAPSIHGVLTSLTPEPGSLATLAVGAAMLLARRRRR